MAVADVDKLLVECDRELLACDRLLKVAQVARMANLSPRTVWRDISRGALAVDRRLVGKRHRTRIRLSAAKEYCGLARRDRCST